MNKFWKSSLAVVLGLMLLAMPAFAAQKAAVQDCTNLPTSGNTVGDQRMVVLLNEEFTWQAVGTTGTWYPTRFAAPSAVMTYASGVMRVQDLPSNDAANVCRPVYTLNKVYKCISTGTWAQLDSISSQVLTGVTPTRGSTALTSDANLFYVNATGLLAGTTGRSFAMNLTATRPDGSRFTAGGDDAALKISATNYNTTSQDNYILRALNAGVTTRDGGTLGTLGNYISATQKANSPIVSYLNGLEIKVEEDSPNATVPTSIYGLNVIYDIVMASPANSAGIRVVNDCDTGLTDPVAAFRVSQTAADRQWQYGLYLDATTTSVADIRMHNGDTLNNGAAGTITASGALASTTTLTAGTGLTITTGGASIAGAVTLTNNGLYINAGGVSAATDLETSGGNVRGIASIVRVGGPDIGVGGALTRQSATASAVLSGATTDIAVTIPTGAVIVGAQLNVEGDITYSVGGPHTWSAAYSGGCATSIGTGLANTKNTKVNVLYDTNTASAVTTNTTNITLTPSADNFAGGVVRAVVYYEVLTPMTSVV